MKKVIKRIFLGVFALMIFALGAGIISSYYFLEVSDYEFENEKIQESVKLVQLSDIHNAEFGKENQRLLKKLKECEPDLIFITGDLIANYAQTECQFRYCGTAIPFLTVRSTAR